MHDHEVRPAARLHATNQDVVSVLLHHVIPGCIREQSDYVPSFERGIMDMLTVAFWAINVLGLGAILYILVTTLLNMRRRRERLQMRRHVQAIEPVAWNDIRRRT